MPGNAMPEVIGKYKIIRVHIRTICLLKLSNSIISDSMDLLSETYNKFSATNGIHFLLVVNSDFYWPSRYKTIE
jgi:hypothetical protein